MSMNANPYEPTAGREFAVRGTTSNVAWIIWALLLLAHVQSAGAQVLNVDIGPPQMPMAPGSGPPPATFAGAANQLGTWQNIGGAGLGPFELLTGACSATLSRSSDADVDVTINNPNTMAGFQRLLDDGQAIAPGQSLTYTFTLPPGDYRVFTYAIAPGSAMARTRVHVAGSNPPDTQDVGGGMPSNMFMSGVTHARHDVIASTGALTIILTAVTGTGFVSGFQIVPFQRLYVDANAAGSNNGADWANAFTNLQSALTEAAQWNSQPVEIWVAHGVYRPAAPGGARTSSFNLLNNVSILGGFQGGPGGGVCLAQRDPLVHVTTLSGDLDNDDGSGHVSDNSFHVVRSLAAVSGAVLDGFTIVRGNADGPIGSGDDVGGGVYNDGGAPIVRNCRFMSNSAAQIGGAVYSAGGTLDLSDSTISGNMAGSAAGGLQVSGGTLNIKDVTLGANGGTSLIADNAFADVSSVNITGDLAVTASTLELHATTIEESDEHAGRLSIAGGAAVAIRGFVATPAGTTPIANAQPSVLRTNIIGPGNLTVETGQSLQLENGAYIDLSGLPQPGACTSMADPQNAPWGTLLLRGNLIIKNGTVQFARIEIANDATVMSCGRAVGGRIVAEATGFLHCNVITTYGDSHFITNPLLPGGQENNHVTLLVTHDVLGGEQGELLEARSVDHDANIACSAAPCALQVTTSVGYDDPLALQRLELLSDARLNVTDRFSPGSADVVYVRELALHPNAVLNLSAHRLYYQTLRDENNLPLMPDPQSPGYFTNGSRIVGVPLLGFSLESIEMDDPCEFTVRVATRLTDPIDPNPLPPAPATHIGTVDRVTDATLGGVMRMQTQADGFQSASSISVLGSFAVVTEDRVTISFQYLFEQDPAAELLVYLRDTPGPIFFPCAGFCCGNDVCEVAHIAVPPPDRPGSIGSSQFATFYGEFARGQLDLSTGTYIELRLNGPASRVLIDHWDPTIQCGVIPCDLNNQGGVDIVDLALALTPEGHTTDSATQCLDTFADADHYLGRRDFAAIDTRLRYNCHVVLPSGAGSAVSDLSSSTLLVAGKGACGTLSQCDDQLFGFSTSNWLPTGPVDPAAAPSAVPSPGYYDYAGNGRLVRDHGNVYQINTLQGPVNLTTAEPLVPAGVYAFLGYNVQVGVLADASALGYSGVFIDDVTFKPDEPNAVYVAPVRVAPVDGSSCPILTAAKLGDTPQGWQVQRLYLPPSLFTPSAGPDPCTALPNTDYFHAREIELSPDGQWVYVASAQGGTPLNDWLLVFDEDAGSIVVGTAYGLQRDGLHAPTAMLASADGYVYMASETNQSCVARVFRYAAGGGTPAFAGALDIDFSAGNCTAGQNFASITSMAQLGDGALWIVGFTSSLFTCFGPDCSETVPTAPFTAGVRALIPPTGVTWSTTAPTVQVSASPLDGLTLPLAALALCGAAGDINSDGCSDLADYAALQNCFCDSSGSAPPCAGLGQPCAVADLNCNGFVDLEDQAALAARLNHPCP